MRERRAPALPSRNTPHSQHEEPSYRLRFAQRISGALPTLMRRRKWNDSVDFLPGHSNRKRPAFAPGLEYNS